MNIPVKYRVWGKQQNSTAEWAEGTGEVVSFIVKAAGPLSKPITYAIVKTDKSDFIECELGDVLASKRKEWN